MQYGKPRCRTFALAATAALTAGAIAAGPSSAKPSPMLKAVKTVHVIEHAITDTENPTGRRQGREGQRADVQQPGVQRREHEAGGARRGLLHPRRAGAGIWECLWTTFLKAGQITVQGPYYDTRNSVLSITGGTGAYRDSRGQMTLLSRDGGKEYDFIFHLS